VSEAPEPTAPPRLSGLKALRVYRHPRVTAMLFLGFSSGLPFLLVFSTLSAWLKQAGIDKTTIGMLSWVGLAYTLKFFWAPVVDRLAIPILTRLLGRRRSWMLLAQCGIAAGLAGLSLHAPEDGLSIFAWLALLVAFSSATQDIAVDAWRIEAVGTEYQGAMAAAYQLGYRVAITVASAGALWLAADLGWHIAYLVMAACVGVGVLTTLVISEPAARANPLSAEQERRALAWVEAHAHLPKLLRDIGEWFVAAVVCPFLDFFSRIGIRTGILILAFAGCYRLTDFTMGVMANPFYLDIGYTLKEIAAIAKGYGIITQIVGTILGGVAIARFGTRRTLVAGSILVIATNLSFATLAMTDDPGLWGLGIVIGADNLAMGVAGTALIAYLSGLTSASYTATQYALFSSFYALPGKLLMGGSGWVVDQIGWPGFFLYTSALGVPALILLYFLMRAEAANSPSTAS